MNQQTLHKIAKDHKRDPSQFDKVELIRNIQCREVILLGEEELQQLFGHENKPPARPG